MPNDQHNLSSQVGRLVRFMSVDALASARAAKLRRTESLSSIAVLCEALPELTLEQVKGGWLPIAQAIATAGPELHSPKASFGAALQQAGYSDSRLSALLSAQPRALSSLLLAAVRFLGAKRQAFDFCDVARLLLTKEPSKYAQLREKIAYDYFRSAAQNRPRAQA